MLTFLKAVFSLTPTALDKSAEPAKPTDETTDEPHLATALKRSGKLTVKQHERRLYSKEPSFIDHLPYGEYLAEYGVMLLDDARSVGAVFEIKPIGTEGRSEDYLNRVRSLVKDALQDSFDELDLNLYVVQFYCQDDEDLQPYIDNLRNYITDSAKGSAFSEQWLATMEKHFRDIGKPGGLFIDERVTNTAWSGRMRKTRMVIYRYVEKAAEENAIEQLNNVCDRVNGALTTAGLHITRQHGEAIHQWLLRWFNPNPSGHFDGLSNRQCYDLLGYAERYGLTVNRIALTPNSGVVLPLFSDAHKLLDMDVNRFA
ncbi:hypothetical protein A1D23_08395 [Chelonobacter oris]|nr:hypothetical protein [Chelonobacter oris]